MRELQEAFARAFRIFDGNDPVAISGVKNELMKIAQWIDDENDRWRISPRRLNEWMDFAEKLPK